MAQVRRGLDGTELPVELRYSLLPNAAARPAGPSDAQAQIARARGYYVNAEFAECEAALSADTAALLGRGERAIAARALFWKLSCRAGAGDAAGAARFAAAFAAFGFEVPSDADSVAPDVERLVTDAVEAAARAPRSGLEIDANARRARVTIDGRDAGCVVPCTLDLVPGDHVVRVDADGFEPQSRTVRLDGKRQSVTLEAAPAPPSLAAQQWSARYAGDSDLDGDSSLVLLSRAVRARHIVLFSAIGGSNTLRGALTIEGSVAARAERIGRSAATSAPTVLKELLARGKLTQPAPPLHRRASFWIGVGAAALAATVVTAVVLREPGVRQEVTF